MSTRLPSLAESLGAAPTVGVRRIALIARQVLRTLRAAHRGRVSLQPVGLETVVLQRGGTPFERAVLPRRPDAEFNPAQTPVGLVALGALLDELLLKPLYLEDSMRAADGQFGGVPMARCSDIPLLNDLHRALCGIAHRCRQSGWNGEMRGEKSGVVSPIDRLTSVLSYVDRFLRVVDRCVVSRRQPPPLATTCRPPARQGDDPALPKVLVNLPRGEWVRPTPPRQLRHFRRASTRSWSDQVRGVFAGMAGRIKTAASFDAEPGLS